MVDWKALLNESTASDLKANASWPVEGCSSGWVYNKTTVTSSIVIDVSNEAERFPPI